MINSAKDMWRERWLRCINELTSFDLQKKSWLDNKNINPHWSFVEFMCSYFDDLAIDNNYKTALENNWLTNQEFEIITEWHIALDQYQSPKNDDNDREAILIDSKWVEVLRSGVTAKSKLTEVLNEREKQILTEKVNY